MSKSAKSTYASLVRFLASLVACKSSPVSDLRMLFPSRLRLATR